MQSTLAIVCVGMLVTLSLTYAESNFPFFKQSKGPDCRNSILCPPSIDVHVPTERCCRGMKIMSGIGEICRGPCCHGYELHTQMNPGTGTKEAWCSNPNEVEDEQEEVVMDDADMDALASSLFDFFNKRSLRFRR